MTQTEAIAALNVELAHLWMIRTFLKHADEIQGEDDFLLVPRTLYDTIRAVETAFQENDEAKYLRRLRGKMSKLRKMAAFFAAEHTRVSAHTNFGMASQSLTGSIKKMDAILAQVVVPAAPVNETDDES